MDIFSFFRRTKTTGLAPNTDTMPAPFDFVLEDASGKPLIASSEQEIEMWYTSDGQKHTIEDLKIRPMLKSSGYGFYASTMFAPLRSSDGMAKTFSLRLDGGKKGTLFLDVARLRKPHEGEWHQYREVRFNGKAVALDRSHRPALFVLRQQ
jgi:hypothetical protein